MARYKNHTVYLGKSLEIFNAIRDILQENHVDYKYKMHNHNDALISPGRGVGRSVVGNIGNTNDNMYEVLVAKEDMERAKLLVRSCKD